MLEKYWEKKKDIIKLGIPEENIYLEVGSATDVIENRPIFFKLINQILKEGDLLAVTMTLLLIELV